MTTFGNRLRAARLDSKATQTDWAKLAGVSQVAISYWEADSRKPRADSLLRLALAAKLCPACLVLGEHDGKCLDKDVYIWRTP